MFVCNIHSYQFGCIFFSLKSHNAGIFQEFFRNFSGMHSEAFRTLSGKFKRKNLLFLINPLDRIGFIWYPVLVVSKN